MPLDTEIYFGAIRRLNVRDEILYEDEIGASLAELRERTLEHDQEEWLQDKPVLRVVRLRITEVATITEAEIAQALQE